MMDNRLLSFILIHSFLVVLIRTQDSGSITPCSNIDSIDFDISHCLDVLRKNAEDRDKFWFGNSYVTNCFNLSEFSPECYNPFPSDRDSLASRIFRHKLYHGDRVKYFLKVTYETHAGSYEACGNTYTISKFKRVDVDPLSDSQSLSPFQLLSRPMISWKIENDQQISSNHTTFYIMVIIDVGYVTINGLYINIPNNDIEEGQAIVDYKPPLNPTSNDNPYAFLLFTQKNFISLPPQWLHKLSQRNVRQFEDFLIQFNIIGPVGLSWLTVQADPYSADRKGSPGNMNTCSKFVNQEFKKKQIPYLPQSRPELNVYMDITFKSAPIQFSCCCQDHSYQSSTHRLNPIGDYEANAVLMRTDSRREFILSKAQAFPQRSRDFKDDLHTLVVVDPDSPFAIFGSASRPFIHMLVVNIREADVDTGDVVLPYIGPSPPDNVHHTYYFLLFKQAREFHPVIRDYAFFNCSALFRGRCGFDMAAMIQDAGLELVGSSWQRVKKLDYARCVLIDAGMDEQDMCAEVEGYTPNCSARENSRNAALTASKHVHIWLLIITTILFHLCSDVLL